MENQEPVTQPDSQDARAPEARQLVPLVTVFSAYATQANEILRRNAQEILAPTTFFEGFRVISAYKKDPNLKDLLVRARLAPLVVPGNPQENRGSVDDHPANTPE